MKKLDPEYKDGKVNLYENVTQPAYDTIIDWMKLIEGSHVSYDCWARGNYTRRLIYQRNNGVEQLFIPFTYVDELRWAYKRLALVDLPVEFIYHGTLSSPTHVISLCPSDIDLNGGWGYTGTLGSSAEINGRECFPILGFARLIPESIIDWLLYEVPQEFIEGKVFVSPAELIGMYSKNVNNGIKVLSDIAGGVSIQQSQKLAQAILKLDIPFLDNLSHADLRKFLADYEGELFDFRKAFRQIIFTRNETAEQIHLYYEELQHEIAELAKSAKYHPLRSSVSKIGGILTFAGTSLSITESIQQASFSSSTALGFGAAAVALFDLWKQFSEREKKMSENPFYIFWKLGMTRPSQVIEKNKVSVGKIPPFSYTKVKNNDGFHWLCPPTNGFNFPTAIRI